jgi:gamma-glutamyl phosphate reductase
MTYRSTWRDVNRAKKRNRNRALLYQQNELKRQEQEARRIKEQELRKLKPKAVHMALVRRTELFTDEEMAAEVGCTVEELLAFESEFIDDKRRKWLQVLGYSLLCVPQRKVMAQDLSSELW